MIDNGFWNHSKQHSSKTLKNTSSLKYCFGTIRNNTALKPLPKRSIQLQSFGTIRNNTALKQASVGKFKTMVFWNHSKQHSSKTS